MPVRQVHRTRSSETSIRPRKPLSSTARTRPAMVRVRFAGCPSLAPGFDAVRLSCTRQVSMHEVATDADSGHAGSTCKSRTPTRQTPMCRTTKGSTLVRPAFPRRIICRHGNSMSFPRGGASTQRVLAFGHRESPHVSRPARASHVRFGACLPWTLPGVHLPGSAQGSGLNLSISKNDTSTRTLTSAKNDTRGPAVSIGVADACGARTTSPRGSRPREQAAVRSRAIVGQSV